MASIAPTKYDEERRFAVGVGARPSWYRPDVEGLRAVAILLVVLYHVGVPWLPGGYIGVDVFFVISGYLITSLLLRELAATGRVSIVGFYSRRFMRLLPAAAVVIAATLAASWLWLPATRFRSIATDALMTAAYGMNWRLAERGTDYLSSAEPPSPLQHFWSLAVEEQFYAVWPLVLATIGLIYVGAAQAANINVAAIRRTVTVVLVVIVAGSLAMSISQTGPWAFFGTQTRAWELAAGALVAVFADRFRRVSGWWAFVLVSWGLLLIGLSATGAATLPTFHGSSPALPAVFGAVLVIAYGHSEQHKFLTWRPMVFIGSVSYGWYLWHWPVLIIAPYVLGGPPDLVEKLGLAALALVYAWTSAGLVENPLRRLPAFKAHPGRGAAVGLALTATIAVLALVAAAVPLRPVPTSEAAGVVALDGGQADRELADLIAASADRTTIPADLTPALAAAADDKPPIYADGCDQKQSDTTVKTPCMYGDPAGTSTMVLFGDSHAGHWWGALDTIARQRGMRLAVVTKSACNAASVLIFNPDLNRPYTECVQWRAAALDYINTLRPALVVASSNASGGNIVGVESARQDQAWTDSWVATVEALARSNAKVVVLEDSPWPVADAPGCVASHPTNIGVCNRTPAQGILKPERRRRVSEAVTRAGATVIDSSRWFCTDTVCPVIVGNILVYKDGSHMTNQYSKAIAPALAQHLLG